jgi:hypothetical protein
MQSAQHLIHKSRIVVTHRGQRSCNVRGDDVTNQHNELEHILADANHLLAYAVEAGIEIEADVAQKIISAEKQGTSYWEGADGGALLAAITKLASRLLPVTSETLRGCREDARHAIRCYTIVVYVLAAVLVPASIFTAIDTGITNTINTQIKEANAIVLELHTRLSTPDEKISALQQLAIRTRAIQSRARQLNIFDVAHQKELDTFELPPNLNAETSTSDEIKDQITKTTQAYQQRRLYATNILDVTSILFGAVSATVLPVLYALLGASAAVLRVFTQQLQRRTFSYSYASPARFIIAAIGGGVIGLFNITIGEGLTPSPLALAFLVGYSTDVFFSFLEGSLPNASQGAAPTRIPTAPPRVP